jgi:sugar phosphate isomerase/epimerase
MGSRSVVFSRRQLLKRAAGVAGLGAAMGALPWKQSPAADAKAAQGFKYSICNETFKDWPCERAFAYAAECGYQGIEIAPFTIANYVTDISAKRRAEIRRQAERAKLDVVGLHWLLAKTAGLYVTTPDAEIRRRTAVYLGELARFCAELGGKILVLGSPQQRNLLPGVSRQQAMTYAAEVLSAAMPAMEKAGVVLAIEPLGPADTNFILTAAEGVELMKLVNSPHCRLHLDCKAMATEPTPIPDLIRKYRSEFVHFHANDPNLQGPGFGKLDFVPIFQALREVSYSGWISVEVFNYAPGPERLARESIAYMRRCEAKIGEH